MVPVARAPPQHIEISATDLSARSSSWRAVVIRRLPVAPTGWPSAIAPPLTFTLSMSVPSTWCQERTTDANASFTSKRSMSESDIFARSSTRFVPSIGPSSK